MLCRLRHLFLLAWHRGGLPNILMLYFGQVLGVFGLSAYTDDRKLRETFEKFGRLASCTLIMDRKVRSCNDLGSTSTRAIHCQNL